MRSGRARVGLGQADPVDHLVGECEEVLGAASPLLLLSLHPEDVAVPCRTHDEAAVGANSRLEQKLAVRGADLIARLLGHREAPIVGDLHAAEDLRARELGSDDLRYRLGGGVESFECLRVGRERHEHVRCSDQRIQRRELKLRRGVDQRDVVVHVAQRPAQDRLATGLARDRELRARELAARRAPRRRPRGSTIG